MRPFADVVLVALLAILCSMLDSAAAANCYDEWVGTSLGADQLTDCCGGAGVTLPDSLTTLATLTKLQLIGCDLAGELPVGMGNLSNLKVLIIENSPELGGPLPDMSMFTQMTHLTLAGCQLNGPLPSSFSSLSETTLLNLRGNYLTGTLPAALTELTKVQYLGLEDNAFSGSLPSVLTTMQTLEILLLADNKLTGSIPQGLKDLPNLKKIALAGNRFYGGLPNFVGLDEVVGAEDEAQYNYVAPGNDCSGDKQERCSMAAGACNLVTNKCCSPDERCDDSASCYDYWFQRNPTADRLTNCLCTDVIVPLTLPDSLETLTQFTQLHLVNCKLVGKLPVGLDSLNHLVIENSPELVGPLPDMSKFTKMSHLVLAGCQLTGPLPSSFSSMSEITLFNLRGNRLTGTLPEALTELTKVKYVGLEDNSFSGSLPSVLGTMQTLEILLLAVNKLTGSIPQELKDLPNLGKIALGGNRFHSGLPNFDGIVVVNAEPTSMYNYLAPGDDCSGVQATRCSLAETDACNILDACCSPGEECRTERSCSTSGSATCPGDEFACEDAQFCVEGLCGDGPEKGMCCGSTNIDTECVGVYANTQLSLSNWYMLCEDHSDFGLHGCTQPTALPADGTFPTGGSHLVCENDDLASSDGNFDFGNGATVGGVDGNVTYLSLRGGRISASVKQVQDKFPNLKHLDLSGIDTRENLILSSRVNWTELAFLDVSGLRFGCTGFSPAINCFHSTLTPIVPKLRVLDISNMGMTEAIQVKGVASISTLEELYMNDNGLETLDEDFFSKLTSLTKLRIRGNNIPGTLPPTLYKDGFDCDVREGAEIIGTATPTTPNPSLSPTKTKFPSLSPSKAPSTAPSSAPSKQPTLQPTSQPTLLTQAPSKESSSAESSPVGIIAGSVVGVGVLAAVAVVVMMKKKKDRMTTHMGASEGQDPVVNVTLKKNSEQML